MGDCEISDISKIVNVGALIMLSSVIILALILCSSKSFAESSTVDDIEISVPVACTMAGSGMGSHSTSISAGTTVEDIGLTTAKVICNDNNGFAVYAIGFSGDQLGDNRLIGPSGSVINTGLSTTDTSSWAMMLSTDPTATYPITITEAFNEQYALVPSTFTKVAERITGTDGGENAEGSTFTTTYRAHVTLSQASGAYAGKVKYVLVHPNSETPAEPIAPRKHFLTFHPNSSLTTGTMEQVYIENGKEYPMSASNYNRPGYGFAGWNDEYDYSGTFYGPNEKIVGTEELENNGKSLYAVWVEPEGYLQDSNTVSSVCNRLTQASSSTVNNLNSVSALTDRRDGNVYAIAKLADGNCWMIENMRLSNVDASGGTVRLSINNTNNPLTINGVVSLMNDDGTISDHLSATSNNWCSVVSEGCVMQSVNNTGNTVLYIDNTSGSRVGNVYSYGNYYNWYSATAGTVPFDVRYDFEAPGSICPKGWRLPTGGPNSELSALNDATNAGATNSSIGLRSFPTNFVFSGIYNAESQSIRYRHGFSKYWSSTVYGDGAYLLSISSSEVNPLDMTYRYEGSAVRCIADM